MANDIKKYLKIEDQVNHLIEEGMIINDKDYAKNILSRVNYYHLSGYWHNFYNEENKFVDNITFEKVYSIYLFDAELRRLIMPLTEVLEIKLRTHFSNFIGDGYGPLGYINTNAFYDPKMHQRNIVRINEKIDTYKEKTIIKHHFKKYAGVLPIWVMLEIVSFNDISKLYANLTIANQKDLIQSNYSNRSVLNNVDAVKGWIKTICEVRNICAHYERLYNTRLSSNIKLPKVYKSYNLKTNKLFAILIVMNLLIDDQEIESNFIKDVKALFDKYDVTDVTEVGFPTDWDSIIITKKKA